MQIKPEPMSTLLERLTGADKAQTDEDGDYPVVYQDLPYYVRVVGTEDPVVQVFAFALVGIESTPGRQVLIETDILAESLDPAGFRNACNCVGSLTTDVARDLHTRFGGQVCSSGPRKRRQPQVTSGRQWPSTYDRQRAGLS